MRSEGSGGKDAGVARVLKASGREHAGMAVVVGPRHVITCAHVVNDAVGRPHASQGKVKERITVDFPLSARKESREGTVIAWHPMGAHPEFDVAVLHLDRDIPPDVDIAIFGHFKYDISEDSLSVFGIAAGHLTGKHVDAVLKGPTTSAEVQIDDAKGNDTFVRRGFSGAGVWDKQREAFVGIVRAVDTGGGRLSAYMTPTAALVNAWEGMPCEERSLPRGFVGIWTGVATGFLIVMLYLFHMSQSAPAERHPQLALFAGMHLYIVGAALIGWMWKLWANDFKLHSWAQRIPRFAGTQLAANEEARRILGVVSILCFVLLPMYAQGHFIRKFHKQGHIYIYVKEFGFTREQLHSGARPCIGTRLCQHPDAGRYSTVAPIAPAEGGYWNDRYHYGDIRPKSSWGKSVTFYPILQPIAIFILTALVVALHGRAAWLTFAGAREPRVAKSTPPPVPA
jgi:hypothetical protein